MEEIPGLTETLAKLRSTLPEPRKDGQPRRQMLPKREEALAELLEAVARHVAIRDGIGEVSTRVCRGCSHDRTVTCPMGTLVTALYELGRGELFVV